ncbi:hypothetical protein LSCM4_07811 [Leishmania orientalis]|uniref:Kinesin motor domain-containing protein n=1 Tax=Leishmania orientalis TaxID=2249476 RepID=A0A836H5R1_9TRYP|nr:hypothetical protein LSCM4_07811 [Leishmania orientalis]
MPERVHVVVRIRPFIASDPPDAELNTLVLDPAHVSVGDNRVFKVDRAYMMEDATELIYAECVAPLIRRFLRGFNASVLAYGQTGTGKTFTVQSLLPLLLKDIMADDGVCSAAAVPPNPGMPTSHATTSPRLYLQYVEVYGETIRDLLEDSAAAGPRRDGDEPGKIRLVTTAPGARTASPPTPNADRQFSPMGATSPTTGCVLVGATIANIFTTAQAAELIALGDARRATGSTNVHQYSSRSHAILTLFHPRYACRLDVVDLAGSERERKTGNVGVRFQESIAINTGLLALGNVMRALSRINRATNGKDPVQGGGGHSRTQHVPYRSSRLTRLLQDTLGGNSATVFIACVAPDTYNRDETLRTLQYCSLALRVLNEPLQQYERLRRAQSPLSRRGSPSAAAAVSPLSLRKGLHVDAAESRAYRENDEADELKTSHLKVLELQSAYAGLQQQYDEQAEVIASMCAAYAATKERLALCERELRKDESIFTHQIRAMQELVCENQKLRRRLAKTTTTNAAASATRQEKAAVELDPRVCGSARTHELDRTATNSRCDGEDCTEAMRDMLLAGALDAADGVGISPQLAPSHLQGHRPHHSAPAAATAATRPPLSAHSPHRPHGFTGGAQSLPLEETPPALTRQAGVRVHDAGRDAEAPTYSLGGNCAATLHVLDGATPAAAAAPASAEPAQSFIRYILGLHGIHPEAEEAGGVDAGFQRGRETAPPSLQSSIRKSVTASAGRAALSPAQVFEPTKESNADDRARLAGAPPLLDCALSRRLDRSIPSSPVRAVDGVLEDDRSDWDRQVDRRTCDTDAAQVDSPAVLLLATEVLRHQGTSADLRNQVQVLQAELDSKQREAALLRLELQEMKELLTT